MLRFSLKYSMRINLLLFGMLLWLAPGTFAGGWASVTLDSLPIAPQEGESLTVGFMIRQHGITPINNAWETAPLRPYLSATHQETGQSIRVDARQEGPIGHYIVEVSFPDSGRWDWQVKAEPFGTFPDRFEPLTVLTASDNAAEAEAVISTVSSSALWWFVIFSLILGGGVAIIIQRDQTQRKTGLILSGTGLLILLLFAIVSWPAATTGATGSSSQTGSRFELTPEATYGKALFVAKSCPACHIHAKVSNSAPGPVIGPSLTHYEADPAFISQWLRDPQAMRPGTQMPNLNLNDNDIEALIAFLKTDAN